MVKFPSWEWAVEFQARLNANPAYAEAAQAWEADFLLRVLPEDPTAASPGIRLDLRQGTCREATYLPETRQVSSEFVFQGTTTNWGRLLRHEVDPLKAIVDGTFQLKGNLAKAMRFTRAAKELMDTASGIPSEV
ncbi:MAG: SCP2 sterol-binding domain-containing protein [Thermoplasmata archaeon]